MQTIKEVTKGKYTAKIFIDETPENPRDWDNLGTMDCAHKRYKLGDKQHTEPILAMPIHVIGLPLFLYDHSGITMNTSGFSCIFDSGQVGWIYVDKQKVKKELGYAKLSKKRVEKVLTILRQEVETYDQYLTGDVYGYEILNDLGECQDGCSGFFGLDYITEEVNRQLEFYNDPKL